MPFAFDEFRSLVSTIKDTTDDSDPIARYVCAMVAELAYYHVPQFEIDHKKRALVIPCEAYQTIIGRGAATDVRAYLAGLDFTRTFVVIERGAVAVGILHNDLLFIGFRGTTALFDWKINLRAPLITVHPARYFDMAGKAHRGFTEEAVRIAARIRDHLRAMPEAKHIFLAGHSLGGAVAALSKPLLYHLNAVTCLFASPRYCDIAAYYTQLYELPIQFQRPGDIVPFVPPRGLGYADHPRQFNTAGEPLADSIESSGWPFFIWRVGLFLKQRAAPHSMESYRKELGQTAKIKLAAEALVPVEKLAPKDLGA